METAKTPVNYLFGLDLVRVVALGLVTAQHAFSLLEMEASTIVGQLSIGQIGVAMFLMVSGYLASESRRPPVNWLVQRLRRVYPAYWLSLAGSFVLAGVAGHKEFDAWQVVAQFLGIGLFTHLEKLVNSPTWFVTLLLICYVGSFVGRLLKIPLTLSILAAVVFAVIVGSIERPWLFSHLLTYALACCYSGVPRGRGWQLTVPCVVVLCALAANLQPAFGYTALALAAMELALQVRQIPWLVQWLADYSYEYYLVHGVALYGAIRFLPSKPFVAVSGAIAASLMAAILLKWVMDRIDRWLFPKPAKA
jgi:peptidoglycan/LPS O-acetylase OafA/YrhL